MTYSTMKASAIPGSRWLRLAKLGTLAGGVAGKMLAEGARQFVQGKRPSLSDLLLTPANARRVTEQLAQLRGAAMKVGQLLSMDAGDLLPPELSEILARLRADASPMPMSQVVSVLNANWGADWIRHFQQFSFTPVAAASIGQVHLGVTKDGEHLAIKIQYPGVRKSIDSDVDNVAMLLRLSGLIPDTLDIAPLLQEAKRQLHHEADYRREADCMEQFAELLGDANHYILPQPHSELCTESVLAMTRMHGLPVESLANASNADRDRVAGLLLQLLFREIFEFGLVQTDPNFANYRYDSDSRRLILLDFGATRAYPATMIENYRLLMRSAVDGDRHSMSAAAHALGYFQANITDKQRQLVLDMFVLACEPLRHAGDYDFGQSDLAARIRDAGLAFSMDSDYWHTPPADTIFLHRKLGGLYLLAARLKARVNVRNLAANFLSPAGTPGELAPVD
jgi:predicted unusual protein kinase regulating ubiquinone biosynthesis (AarF/ABC1/UbiB family)